MGVFGRIARVAARSQADLTDVLSVYDLTPASFDVLANLRRSDPPHRKTPGELAESSMMSTGGMTFRVDKLTEADLVAMGVTLDRWMRERRERGQSPEPPLLQMAVLMRAYPVAMKQPGIGGYLLAVLAGIGRLRGYRPPAPDSYA